MVITVVSSPLYCSSERMDEETCGCRWRVRGGEARTASKQHYWVGDAQWAVSQREKRREERGARERDRYAEKRSVCVGLFFFNARKQKAQACCAHISLFNVFNVHIWLFRTRAGDSWCTGGERVGALLNRRSTWECIKKTYNYEYFCSQNTLI